MLDNSCKEIKTDFAVSITRNSLNEINISIKDNKSRLEVLSLKMSLEEFALAVTNLAERPASGSLFQSPRHGLKHENKTYSLDLGMGCTEFNQKFPKTLDKLAVVNMGLGFAEDKDLIGWNPDISNIDNSKYWTDTNFRLTLRRFTQ